MRVAYLGPPGTFSEEAVARCDLVTGHERRDFPSIPDVFDALARGDADHALLPIENSLEGTIGATLDLLVQRPGFRIRAEVLLPVRQNLLVNPGATLASIRKVLSHPQPLGQCAGWLRANLPGVPLEATLSTADAARQAMGKPDLAAIGARASAARYGLEILEEDIQDGDENVTRFVLLGREDGKPTGRDRTSIAFTLDRDRPGGLYEVIGEFARRQINLSKIESRPNKRALGHYVFYIDFEGHRAEPKCAEALAGVLERVHALHLLGSYARG